LVTEDLEFYESYFYGPSPFTIVEQKEVTMMFCITSLGVLWKKTRQNRSSALKIGLILL